jgi:hypothetical protein
VITDYAYNVVKFFKANLMKDSIEHIEAVEQCDRVLIGEASAAAPATIALS